MIKQYDESFVSGSSFIVEGKQVTKLETFNTISNSNGIRSQEVLGSVCCYEYYLIQPSPVSLDKWLQSDSRDYWKDKISESKFSYDDVSRNVVVLTEGKITQTIDKDTGVLLLFENNNLDVDGKIITTKLINTNIFDSERHHKKQVSYPEIPSITAKKDMQKQTTHKIPDWVKNTMQWYLDGSISETEMISAIQFLVKEGIVKLN
jgi:hypothetical protein